MPMFQGLINEDGLAQILAYIKSLTPQVPETVGAHATKTPARPNERQNQKP
jgi:hypothetical protein